MPCLVTAVKNLDLLSKTLGSYSIQMYLCGFILAWDPGWSKSEMENE